MSNGAATHVHVIGPNLGSSTEFVFHVHAAGCADIKRKPIYRHADGVSDKPVELGSMQEVVEYIYDGQIFSDNAGDPVWGKWEAYEPDFKWFPCLGDFPEERPDADDEHADDEMPNVLALLRDEQWIGSDDDVADAIALLGRVLAVRAQARRLHDHAERS